MAVDVPTRLRTARTAAATIAFGLLLAAADRSIVACFWSFPASAGLTPGPAPHVR